VISRLLAPACALVLVTACTKPATPPPAPADIAVDAAVAQAVDPAPPGIGEAGGVLTVDGATLTVPEGALKGSRVFAIASVKGDALADWPRGTELGFVFTPAGERFRVPVTIALPHPDGGGEIVCENQPGERQQTQYDGAFDGKPFPVHVSMLPRRCAVYTPEHAKALQAARAKEAAMVDKGNSSYHWEIKGQVCDPHDLVRPNAGRDLREPPGIGGCPAGMAPIPGRPGACVDRWEPHLVEVLEDGTEHTWTPYFNPAGLKVRAKSAPGAVPQAYISQVQAGAACAASGKRLCKDDEWVLACKGSKKTQYPYGNDEKRGTCNDHRDPHPAMQYLESKDLSVFTKLEHPCINQVPDSLLPGGAKTACTTPEGVFDIVGNLHEWTADPSGHFRGGYYVDTWLNGRGCDYVTTAHEARYWDYSTGFRCCADAAARDK
jgi:Sulfatase-modifying factor enzyme 1